VLPVVERGVVVVVYGAGSFMTGVMACWWVGSGGVSVSWDGGYFVGKVSVLFSVVFALGLKPRRDEIGWKRDML
jgi:hypothetical protein